MHNGAIMSSELRHLVDREQAYPLLRLTGVLDAETAPTIRAALLDVLAGQPEALVIDVGDLRPASPEAVAVLHDLRRDTADWPGTELALCGIPENGGSGERGLWRNAGWPVWPDSRHAFAALGASVDGRRLSVELQPHLGAARRARELITEACGRWDRPELAGPACIVATEMVNNVVVHAGTPMVVLLATHGSGLSVAVRDHSPVIPTYTGGPVSPTAYGGRGMLLIDSVADRWGSLPLADGKVVWALLASDRAPTPADDQRGETSMADPARG
jgi:anti-anti-sigma regulatory factor